jgi:hypothetical protein
MRGFLFAPFILQTLCMLADEMYFHRRRGLGRWERWGHPVDTAAVLAVYAFVLAVPPASSTVVGALGLVALSCLIITKDEWVHRAECTPAECWLHALLFVVHPVQLGTTLALWPLWHSSSPIEGLEALETFRGLERFLPVPFVMTATAFVYQTIFWNVVHARKS